MSPKRTTCHARVQRDNAALVPGLLAISFHGIFYISLGGVTDELAMMLLIILVNFPVMALLEFGIPKDEVDIRFGIFVFTVVGIGLIAPPIGLGVFIVTSIARDVAIVPVCRRTLPFVAINFLRLAVLAAFQAVTLFLVRALN
jgi:C4-dicarboxylate transporter DctM subunit